MPVENNAFTYRIPHFFDLLSQLDTSIPIESQWIVWFHRFPKPIIEMVSKYEDYIGTDSWTNVKACVAHGTADPLQTVKGCIFANQINIPGESVSVERAGEGYRGGYVKGPLTPVRAEFGNFTANFLETNLSFGDLVIRPWTIMVAHLGLIAREGETENNSIKANISVFHMAKAGAGVNPIVRKYFNFYDCVPISVSNEEYNYEPTAQVKMRQVEFLYSYYTVDVQREILKEQPHGPSDH